MAIGVLLLTGCWTMLVIFLLFKLDLYKVKPKERVCVLVFPSVIILCVCVCV